LRWDFGFESGGVKRTDQLLPLHAPKPFP